MRDRTMPGPALRVGENHTCEDDGQAYRIEADIQTIAQDCWVSFEVAIPTYDTEPMASFFQAIRSGMGDDGETTYVYDGLSGEWREAEKE